jgi:predicted Zn-dependent protease
MNPGMRVSPSGHFILSTPWPSILTAVAAMACGASLTQPAPAPDDGLVLPEAPKTLRFETGRPTPGAPADPLLDILASEAQRMGKALSSRGEAPVHHLAYEVTDATSVNILCVHGAIVSNAETRRRLLDLDVRVGSPELDNTHPRTDTAYFRGAAELPLDHAPDAIRRSLWWETDQAYKKASAELIQVRAERNVGVAKDADVDDFSSESPTVHLESAARMNVDRAAWESRVRALGALFREHDHVHGSFVRFEAHASTRYFASTAGDRVQTGRTHGRLSFGASSTAPDGSELSRSDEIDVHVLESLPSQEVIRARVAAVIDELRRLLEAPVAEPFVGPAILEGKAAAVFFHEIFGHRVEGHRQKGEVEGQTFLDQVGQPIMNSVFDVYDDPTLRSVNGVDLNGYYLVDSEGVRAQRASLIENGVFVGFVMSRMPIRGVARSNGHGRREPGYRAVARQANLVVDPARVSSRADLDRALIEEVRRQKKPYGFRIGEVKGGYTMTQRGDPQAFMVEPVMVVRVYPDGRQELVRGVALEGTPLSVLGSVLHAANDFAVFNGYCGAESGEVPASAVSPSLLLRQVELTRESTTGARPPLIPPPKAGFDKCKSKECRYHVAQVPLEGNW